MSAAPSHLFPPQVASKRSAPRPPPWHLQLLSFHPGAGSKPRHLSRAKIIQMQQLHLPLLSPFNSRQRESPYPIRALAW